MTLTSEERQWVESVQATARRDDWHMRLVGSDVRQLCGLLLRSLSPAPDVAGDEVTEEMLCAGMKHGYGSTVYENMDPESIATQEGYIRRLYKAMRAAAPRQPTEADVIERCAVAIEPKGPRPCDCESCTCGNSDDAQRVAQWDADVANAALLRALKEPKS